jgi:hypothetical protein
MRTWLLFIVGVVFFGCKNTSNDSTPFDKENHNRDYDIEIKNIYNPKNDSLRSWSDKKFPKDSLYIPCGFCFMNEYGVITMQIPDSLILTILRNNNIFIRRTYKKDELPSALDFFNCGPINKIQNIGIRINNGNLAYVEIDSTKHVLSVRYDGYTKELSVEFLKKVPMVR